MAKKDDAAAAGGGEPGAEVPARRRRNNAEIPANAAKAPAAEPLSPEDREMADDLDTGEPKRRAEARVSRITADPDPQYICAIAPGNVNNEFFVKNFGGGKYVIKLWKPVQTKKGGWRLEYDSTQHLDIDRTIPKKTPPWLQEPPAAAPAGGDREDDDRDERPRRRSPRAELLMDAELEGILEANRRARQEADTTHQATMTMLTTTMAAMATASKDMLTARGNASSRDPMDMMDELEERFERRRERHQDPLERMMRMMEMKMMARELGDALKDDKDGDDDDGENPFKSIARELGRGLAEVLKPHLANLAEHVDIEDVTPAPAGSAAAENVTTETVTGTATPGTAAPAPTKRKKGDPQGAAMVNMFLASIRDAIKRELLPQSYAVSLLDMVPAPFHGDLEAQLTPKGLAQLYSIAPDLEPHKEWIEAVAAEIKAQFDRAEAEAKKGDGGAIV